jgi:hypothetical protein
MRTKFLLESFEEFISEVYNPVNEAESRTLSPSEATEIIGLLVKSQKGRALNQSAITKLVEKIFGKGVLDRMKKDWWWADEREGVSNNQDKEKMDEFFKKIVQFDGDLNNLDLSKKAEDNENFRPAVIMGLFYQFVDKETRKKLADDFSKRASNLKLSADKIKKQIEEKNSMISVMGKAPAILGYVDAKEIKKVTETQAKPPSSFSLLDEKNQRTLFLDNSWDLNPEVGKTLRDQLYGVLERRKEGGYTKILELNIQSSASRYRNTGKAETLSWGQLSFKRSQVVYNIIKEVLDELKIPEGDPIREELNSVAKMDINGSNGDGTSGPNPTGVRTGYYIVEKLQTKDQTGSSTFKDVVGADKLMVAKIDAFGNPEGSPSEKKMATLAKKEDYDKFKYVNVSVKIQETTIVPGEPASIAVTNVPSNTISPEIILDKKGVKGEGGGFSFKIKLPKWSFLPVGFGDINPVQGLCGGF